MNKIFQRLPAFARRVGGFTLAALLALGPVLPAQASDIESSNWSETAGSNNASPPNGFPEGMAPSAVNDAARETMRALKSDWNRNHATVAGGGTGDAITVTYTVAPTPVNGQQFCWESTAANTGAATLNVNATGAKAIRKGSGSTALAANDILSGAHVCVSYDLSSDLYHLLWVNTTGFAATGSSNTFTAVNTFSTTGTSTNVIARSTDAGASAAPVLTLDRDSASQADSDDGGVLAFQANDDAGSPNDTIYAEIQLGISDSGDGSEDGALEFRTRTGGTLAQRMSLLAGLSLDIGGGIDNGAGMVTADGYFVDSAKVPTEIAVQVFTASGTYTAPADLVYAIVECVGSGGGGGGADGAGSQAGVGAGGGGGGYARERLTAATIGASQTVTIGAGGAGGAAGNNVGSNGNTTSFGALLSATGGIGGNSMAAGTSVATTDGEGGGIGSGGDLNLGGSPGGFGIRISSASGVSGLGGASILGGGGDGRNGDGVGNAGRNYGGGGAGAFANTTTDRAGGDGAGGACAVTEFKA